MTRERASGGFTLIELTIALVIVALLFAAAILSIGAVTGSKAKAASAELAGTIRALYDTAALSGKTCRITFDLPDPKEDDGQVSYRAECAQGNLTTAKNRDEELKEINREKGRKGKDRNKVAEDDKRFNKYTRDDPSLVDLLGVEQNRVEQQSKYSDFTDEEVKPRQFPPAVKVSVWTRHQREATDSGTAYLYFFPQGFTEKAYVYVTQGNNTWTITVSPLTGKTAVVADKLEIPRS